MRKTHGRRRMIHQKIWDSDQFNKLDIRCKLFYIAIITCSDDYGQFKTDPHYWKRKVFYYDRISTNKITELLEKIANIGLIELKETDSIIIGVHPNWTDYQTLRADRPKASDFHTVLGDISQLSDSQVTEQEKKSTRPKSGLMET